MRLIVYLGLVALVGFQVVTVVGLLSWAAGVPVGDWIGDSRWLLAALCVAAGLAVDWVTGRFLWSWAASIADRQST